MTTPHERTSTAGGYRVRVFEAGSGEPLVFLHSAGGAGLARSGLGMMPCTRILPPGFSAANAFLNAMRQV